MFITVLGLYDLYGMEQVQINHGVGCTSLRHGRWFCPSRFAMMISKWCLFVRFGLTTFEPSAVVIVSRHIKAGTSGRMPSNYHIMGLLWLLFLAISSPSYLLSWSLHAMFAMRPHSLLIKFRRLLNFYPLQFFLCLKSSFSLCHSKQCHSLCNEFVMLGWDSYVSLSQFPGCPVICNTWW